MTERNDMTPYATIRERLRLSPDFVFVDPESFYEMLVSNSDLKRIELRHAGLMGLEDLKSGMCYVVESERLGTDRTW